MSTLFVDGVRADDSWVFVDGEQPVPEGEDVIVTCNVFLEQKQALLSRNSGRLGVHLEADDQIDGLADSLNLLSVVSLDFPSFADGRAFSKARLLRDRFGFQGQIRAAGDVRIDQVQHMYRSGFDALLVTHQPTVDSLIEVNDLGLGLFYQPAASDEMTPIAGRNWARRSNGHRGVAKGLS
ncbi:MAG: DUF934 domain-containing protein [Rhizobiaceae bacterium]